MLQRSPTLQKRASAAEWLIVGLISIIAVCIQGWIAAGGSGIIGFSDSADYLFFADFYRAQFAGLAPPEAVEFYRATRFPPLFPLLLAAFDGGTDTLGRARIIACVITLCMFALLWLWLRRETKSPVAAATVTLLVVVSPGLFLLVLNPVSEPLAMGMLCLTFLLAGKPRPTTDGYLLLALVAGMSTLARSANIALVVAIPVWLYLQNATRKQLLAGTITASAPFVMWTIYRRSIPGANSYLDGMTMQYAAAELGGWPELLYLHPWRLISGFAQNLDYTPDAFSISIAIAILVSAACGWWRRARAKELDAVFFAFYLALILVWPFPAEAMRFMTFVLPLLFLYALLGVRGQTFPACVRGKARAPVVLALLFFLASSATIWHFLDLATLTVDAELRGEQRTQMYFHTPDRATALRSAEGNARVRLAARETARLVPPDDCVYASLPSLLQMQGPVKAIPYPTQFVEGIPVERQLHLCNYFFVAGLKGNLISRVPFHPLDDLRGWTTPVLLAGTGEEMMVAALFVRDGDAASVNSATPTEQGNR